MPYTGPVDGAEDLSTPDCQSESTEPGTSIPPVQMSALLLVV
jgi:hypothetical protein